MGCGLQVQGRQRSARRVSLALLALAVLLLHVRLMNLIEGRDAASPARLAASVPPAIEFRTLAAPAAQRSEPVPVVDRNMAVSAPSVERRVVPQRRPTAVAVPVVRPQVEPEVASSTVPSDAPAPAPSAEPAPPLYRTAVAPSAQLRFRVERGDRVGSAELNWQVLDDAYEAQLDIVYEGSQRRALRHVSQVSRGRIDATGVAPERHTERRPRAGMLAVNFERDAGEVSFSGPSWRLALAAGAQDGLSWMLQLAAVAQAEPERASAGGEIVLTVVGVRGEARPWRFRFEAVEPLKLGEGVVAAAKWVRESGEPYDARIEVWLDPARHHLPVRLRSAAAGSNGVFEMVRLE